MLAKGPAPAQQERRWRRQDCRAEPRRARACAVPDGRHARAAGQQPGDGRGAQAGGQPDRRVHPVRAGGRPRAGQAPPGHDAVPDPGHPGGWRRRDRRPQLARAPLAPRLGGGARVAARRALVLQRRLLCSVASRVWGCCGKARSVQRVSRVSCSPPCRIAAHRGKERPACSAGRDQRFRAAGCSTRRPSA